MNFSILKHIKCPNKSHTNFEGEYEFTSFENLEEVIVTKSIWHKGISKQDLPCFAAPPLKTKSRPTKPFQHHYSPWTLMMKETA